MNDLNRKKETSGIDSLRRNLYEKDKGSKQEDQIKFVQQRHNLPEDWQEETSNKEEQDQFMKKQARRQKQKKSALFKGLLVLSVLFFLISFGVAFFVFYGGVNIVSTENVDLSIAGPTMIGGGEVLSFQVTVQNNNSVDLELADLIVDFPKGSLSADGDFKELIQTRKPLGLVPAGGSVTEIFKGILFGGEGDLKDLIVTIEYRAKDSNAIFFKDRQYDLVIDSSPIGFVIDIPANVMTGQEFGFSVKVISNSTEVLKNVLFVADYPFGFEFKSSNLEPIYKKNVWKLGDINPNSERTFEIRGILTGQDGEERVFNFSGGIQDKDDTNTIKATLASSAKPIFLKKTLFGLDLVIDGNYSQEYVFPSGETIRGDILWSNSLLTQLSDVQIVAELNGVVLDRSSVLSPYGYYKSSDNTITWDKKNNSQLELLNPSTNGSLNFSFSPYSLASISNLGIKNPEIEIKITATGNKSSGNSLESIVTTISKKIKIETDLLLTARALYSVGGFQNSGPFPPQVDKETTFTIVWTATNTSNDVQNAKVKASLPSYVRWLGVSSPYSEDISFSQVGGEIVWEIGQIEAGEGISSSAREISFQVALLPSLSQIGSEPILLKNISIEGEDIFTRTVVNYTIKDLSTRISTDPLFTTGAGKVIK